MKKRLKKENQTPNIFDLPAYFLSKDYNSNRLKIRLLQHSFSFFFFFNKANTSSSKTWTPSKWLQKDRHQIYHRIEQRDEFPLTIVEGRCSIFSVMCSLVPEFFMSLLRRTARSIVKTSHTIHLLGSIEEAAIFPNNYEQSWITHLLEAFTGLQASGGTHCGKLIVLPFLSKSPKKINKMCWSMW